MKRVLFILILFCSMFLDGIAQDVDRLLKVGSGDKIELKVGEVVGIYSDVDDIVDRYDSAYEGAWLEAAYVFFSDGKANTNPNGEYIQINHVNPGEDFNTICGLKPTSSYIDMKIYYVITYYDKRGTKHPVSGDYYFKVKVVGEGGKDSGPLKSISLPSKVSVGRGLHYKLTPSLKPEGASASFKWKTSDSRIVHIVPDSDVYIYGKNEGVATVTVTADNGMSTTTEVHVLPEPEIIKDYDFIGTFYSLTRGVTKALKR